MVFFSLLSYTTIFDAIVERYRLRLLIAPRGLARKCKVTPHETFEKMREMLEP